LTQFPSELGIGPVKKKKKCEKFEAKVYTDTTLALELVSVEIKLLEFDTIPECFGNLTTCQKRDLAKF
jgi:hypothetical protein